jgi:hypothetical protein
VKVKDGREFPGKVVGRGLYPPGRLAHQAQLRPRQDHGKNARRD